MNRIIVGIATMMLLSGVAPAADEGDGLQLVRALVTNDPDGKTADAVRIRLFVKNTGSIDLTVLTRNLQVTLFGYTDRPKEVSLDLSTQTVVDGDPVIPSLYDLSPVNLKAGEVAEIQIAYDNRKALDKFVVVYDMRNDLAKRFRAWSGVVRTAEVKVLKTMTRR